MGRPLVMGTEQYAALRAVKEYSERHPISRETIMAAMEHAQAHRDDEAARGAIQYTHDPGFRCVILMGYRVCFTVEWQPIGYCRHASISLAEAAEGTLPGIPAVQVIGHVLGMRMVLEDPHTVIYYEGIEGHPPRAISIIEPVNPVVHPSTAAVVEPEPASQPS